MPAFFVKTPVGFDQIAFEELIKDNIEKATKDGLLRPNSVDPVNGKNSGNNLGPGTPVISPSSACIPVRTVNRPIIQRTTFP